MAKKSESLFIDSMTLKGSPEPIVSETDLCSKLEAISKEIRQLHSRLAELDSERLSTQKELDAIRANDSIPPIRIDSEHAIDFDNSHSKAEFMLSLFSPRRDVFASREWSKSAKGAGYYPACGNWLKAGCPRITNEAGGYLCKGCHLFSRGELTAEEIIRRNFRNRHPKQFGAVGIYPLRNGNITRFVAIDLDSASWQKDARCLLKTAREAGIPMAWERSCSGNGAHLWIFFSSDIQAAKARKLAFAVIDRARELNPELSMESYDRLFPSQDKLSKGGIGNLILLPLVASAAERGCTLFLDDDGNPIPLSDQLPYLKSIHKLSETEIDGILATLSSEYIAENEFRLSDETLNPGWIRLIPKITEKDFSDPFILYLSTGVSIDKKSISKKAQEAFRRLATIHNPEYYRFIAMHDEYRGTLSSRIPLYEENDRVLKLPRGLLGTVRTMLDKEHIQYEIEDHRTTGTGLDAELLRSLYPRQLDALKALSGSEIGILACAPGFGKTLTALALAARRKEHTLIIVSSRTLLEQWVSVIRKEMKISTPGCITTGKGRKRTVPGSLGGGHDKLSGTVDVATLQSLASHIAKGERSFDYGFVIVDECHHIAAETLRDVMKNLNPKYVLGLSATPKRADNLERIVYAECGQIVYSYSSAKLAYERGIQQQFIPKFIGTFCTSKDFNDILKVLSSDPDRTETIARDISQACSEGRKILVFSRRIEQNHALKKNLNELSVPCIVLDGSMGIREVSTALDHLRNNPSPEVLIATDKLLGEGVDLPELDTLFFVSPFKQPRIVEQCAGRLLRAAEGKFSVRIYDYVDYRIPMLSRMFSRRVSIYKRLGYIQHGNESAPAQKILYDGSDYSAALLDDISAAGSEIILSASFISVSGASKAIISKVAERTRTGIRTELRMRQLPSDTKYNNLRRLLLDSGISIAFSDDPLCFAVIDRKISWYGELNPLGTSDDMHHQASILRIADTVTAECLLRSRQEFF